MGSLLCSKGVGSARHLCIYTETLAQLGTGRSMSMLGPETREKVHHVWKACQVEGGKFWNYSQDEVAELLMSSAGLPEDIAQLMLKRCRYVICTRSTLHISLCMLPCEVHMFIRCLLEFCRFCTSLLKP